MEQLDGELADAKDDLQRAEESAKRWEADVVQGQEVAKKREADLVRAQETAKKKWEANFLRATESAKRRQADLLAQAEIRKRREANLVHEREVAKKRETKLVQAVDAASKKREADLLRAAETAKRREADLVRAEEESVKRWEAELGSMTRDRNRLQDLEKKLSSEKESLRQSLGELEDKRAKLEAEYGNAIAENLSLTASLADCKREAEWLRTDCENVQADHQMALDKCDGQMLQLICERDHCEAVLVKSKSLLEKLGKEHKSLQMDHETLNSLKAKEQAGFRSACEAAKKAAKKTELQLDAARAELSKLKRELHAAVKQKDGVASENASLSQKLRTASEELEETRFRRDALVVEREKLVAAVSRVEKAEDSALKELEHRSHLEVASLRKELAIAAKENAWLAASEASLVRKLDEAAETIRLLDEQQMASAEAIRSSKLTNHSLVQEAKSAKKKHEDTELGFFTLLREKDTSKKAEFELNVQASKLKEDLERMCKEKESASASAERLNAKVQELEALTEFQAQKKTALKQELEDLRRKLSDLCAEKNELVKRFDHEASLLRFKLMRASKEKDCVAAFAKENVEALVTKADSLNEKLQQQAVLVSEKKSSDVSHVRESKNWLVTLSLLEKEKGAVLPSKTEEALTSEEALTTEHDGGGAMEVHHPVKAASDVRVKEEEADSEAFAESLLRRKLDYVAGMMDSFVERMAANVKESDGMRAELALAETMRIQMQNTIEVECSASTCVARKLETSKKELAEMEKRMDYAALDKSRRFTNSRTECWDLERKLVSKDKRLIAKEKECARLLQFRDSLAVNCNSLRATLGFMEKENTDLRREVIDVRFISHHLEGEVERLRKDLLVGMQKGVPCCPVVVDGNVRSGGGAVEVQGRSSTQPTVLGPPQTCDLSAQMEAMRGELACLRHENRVLKDCMHKCQMELEARRRAPGDPRRELHEVNLVSRDPLSMDSCSRKRTSEDGSMPVGSSRWGRSDSERSDRSLHLAPPKRHEPDVQGKS